MSGLQLARGQPRRGLHQQVGTAGDGLRLCSGDMMLEAIVGCARGVKLDPTRRHRNEHSLRGGCRRLRKGVTRFSLHPGSQQGGRDRLQGDSPVSSTLDPTPPPSRSRRWSKGEALLRIYQRCKQKTAPITTTVCQVFWAWRCVAGKRPSGGRNGHGALTQPARILALELAAPQRKLVSTLNAHSRPTHLDADFSKDGYLAA